MIQNHEIYIYIFFCFAIHLTCIVHKYTIVHWLILCRDSGIIICLHGFKNAEKCFHH